MLGDIEEAVGSLPGIEWARANPVTGRLVVAFKGSSLGLNDVIEAVESVEDEFGVISDLFSVDGLEIPGDPEVSRRHGLALAADSLAIGLAVAGRLGGVVGLPMEAAGLVSFVQSQPRLRQLVANICGAGAGDLGLALASAASQALAQGPLGLITDVALRVAYLSERIPQHELWTNTQRELWRTQGDPIQPIEPVQRPVALPRGPVETYSDRAALAAVGGLGLAFLTTRSLRRATSALLVTTPKAADNGKESFAAHLGRTLARRGVLCFDERSLRRLDRVDCVVVDDGVLKTGAKELVQVTLVEGADPDEVQQRLRRLFDRSRPWRTVRQEGWCLQTLNHRGPYAKNSDVRAYTEAHPGAEAMILTHGRAPMAVATLVDELRPETRALVETVREGGHMLAVAGQRALADRLRADLHIGSGERLVDSIQMMQADGCVVALISGPNAAALRTADCGVGIMTRSTAVPWGADLLCANGLASAAFIVEATMVADEVSRQSSALALAGSAVAGTVALAVPASRAARRAMTVLNLAALVSQANAARAAIVLNRRPEPTYTSRVPWHELDADEVLARLKSSEAGLSADEVERRATTDGTSPPPPSLAAAILKELANPLTPVLAGAGLLSGALGSIVDAGLLTAVMGLNGLIGGIQRHRTEQTVRSLELTTATGVSVLRGGGTIEISTEDLVVGDIVQLRAGDAVPADCRILSDAGLEVDESSLTGESDPVSKAGEPSFSRDLAERSSMLYSGSSIAAGEALAVVVATGTDTEVGAAELGTGGSEERPGGVEARLAELTRRSLPFSILGGISVVGAGILRGTPIRNTIETGVNLAVAAVPEGLPLLATMAQLSSARRMAAGGALVRSPRAIEALGRVDVLCADKTGTLTEGDIRLQGVFDGEDHQSLEPLDVAARHILEAALRASPAESNHEPLPHFTDRAVVEGAARLGLQAGGGRTWSPTAELPFEPTRGYHAVVGQHDRSRVLSVKGAPETVLPRCATWSRGGHSQEMDAPTLAALTERVHDLGRMGGRILAVAERQASERSELDDDRVDALDLIGFLRLSDPVRPTAANAIADLNRAGVRVVMVTGDHPSTAEGIAAELGLINGGALISGAELDDLDDSSLDDRLEDIRVFARVTPTHKARLVAAYQRNGHVVVMTGDGANDAPAIRLSDVGVALGENSTAAARGAADLIVPDGRIETLLEAVVEGRGMWISVRQALAILLGGNLGEIAFTAGGALLSGRSPLSPRQLLVVNLLTDVLPAMAIATRSPVGVSADDLLAEGPEASLGASLEGVIMVRATTTAAGAILAWTAASATGRPARARTVALASLVGTQLAQTVVAGGFDPTVLGASLGSVAVLVSIVQTPGVSQFFDCTPLGPVGWGIAGGSAVGVTVAAGLATTVARRVRQRS